MAQYGMLRDYRFTDGAEDIRGSKLYGLDDEKLGKIDDVIFDYSTGLIRYVVVDTGGWLRAKKFIVPADRLKASSEHKDDLAADLTKSQVESFPPYDEKDLESDEQWSDYEARYRSEWKADPVMHRAETDRNITPTTQQMPRNSPSERAAGSATGRGYVSPEAETAEIVSMDKAEAAPAAGFAASTSPVVISSGAMGIGPRWDTFQNRLRERRKEVIGTGQRERDQEGFRKAS